MKEIDVVKLVKDYKDIKAGTIGTIVSEYEDSVYEVEFVDKDGQTIGGGCNDAVTTVGIGV